MPYAVRPAMGLVAVLAFAASGCGGTGIDAIELAGTWTGTALLPNAYTTTLQLTQSGSTIGGTISIAGVLNQPLAATLNDAARTLDWTAYDGCEEWSGTFTVASDGASMSGPVLNDLTGCPSGSNSSGTISVSR